VKSRENTVPEFALVAGRSSVEALASVAQSDLTAQPPCTDAAEAYTAIA